MIHTQPDPYQRARDENLDDVRRAGSGVRNETLNRAAYATAQLSAAARFDEAAEKHALLMAAKSAGLGEAEAKTTINSAWKSGVAQPRRFDRVGREPMPFRKHREPGTSYFEFLNADGLLACRKVRIDKADGEKDFRWQHPDGKGGWLSGRGGPAIPYRLPDLLAAPTDAIVYVVEGERKADKLASWGLVATSSKDLPDDLSVFAGRTVAILPDNDEKGAEIAGKLLRALDGVANKTVLVELPGLPHQGDIIDWTGTADELRLLTAKALAASPEAVELLPFVDAGNFAGRHVPPREWGLEGWEPWRSSVYLTGIGASGKSLLTQQRMTCSAAGLPFLGMQLRAGVSIYISCEDDIDELHRRQDAINAALGITWADLRGKLYLVSLKGELNKELCTFDADGRMHVTPRWNSLKATVQRIGAQHVALDNVAHFFTGNENIRNHVAAFSGLLDGFAGEIDGVVLLLGHPNKAGAEFSGSTAWENQVRSRIYLSLDQGEDGVATDPDARVLTNSKPNYSRRGEAVRFLWHKWAFVLEEELPRNVAAELTAVSAANADNAIFLSCLAERHRQRRAVSEKRSPTYAPTVFATMSESKRIGKIRLEQAMDRLFRSGKIERAELWDGDDRKPVFGLRETAGNGAVNTMRETRETVPEALENRAGNAANTHTYIKDIEGAAQQAAAPSHGSQGLRPIGPPIFPADDDSDLGEQPYRSGGWG